MVQQLLLSFGFVFFVWQFQVPSCSAHQICSPDEGLALFNFKQGFTINPFSLASKVCDQHDQPSYPKTVSWNQSTDCCRWDGVTCDKFTGKVISLELSCSQLQGTIHPNNSLFQLPHLQMLNLAYNDFSGTQFPPKLGLLTSMTHLNFSHTYFSGQIPSAISDLSKLISLDLSSPSTGPSIGFGGKSFLMLLQNLTQPGMLFLDHVNISAELPKNLSSYLTHLSLVNTGLHGELPTNIFSLPKMRILRLDRNYYLTGPLPEVNKSAVGSLKIFSSTFTGIFGELPESIGFMKSLKNLAISSCDFSGSLPQSIGNVTEITHMDLSYNNFNSYVPSTVSYLNQLVTLDLQGNHLEGQIPDVFGNLQKLTLLHLGYNKFSGQFPCSVANLTQLQTLAFMENSVSGSLPSIASGLQKLRRVYLYSNFLNGSIPSWLFSHPSLVVLFLNDNQFSQQIDDFKSKSLEYIVLSNNQLHGPIPRSFSTIANLSYLDLSWNNLSGAVDMNMFSNLNNLQYLGLSYNDLALIMNDNVDIKFPALSWLSLSSCGLKEFPDFLRTSKNLAFLDLSNNKIHGEIPSWLSSMWPHSLQHLNLSHNFLTCFSLLLPWKGLIYLDMQSNFLQGPLPSSICNLKSLHVVNLSMNKLTGTIPRCLRMLNELSVLDLRSNNLMGTIPNFTSNFLNSVSLNDNKLEGPLPRSLTNCTYLEVLNLGNNNVCDTFPWWLETLPELQVLILKSNQFHGSTSISRVKDSFPKLRILDLSCNEFTGPLPAKFIQNFKAMMNMDADKAEVTYMGFQPFYSSNVFGKKIYYEDFVSLVLKGLQVENLRVLTIFTTIDLSSNNFEGEIPEVIGNLNSLRLLNFSHNKLTGHIPSTLRNMRKLEALDLSWNQLVGEIPSQLTSLTYLAFLNLSQNYLVGQIPRGNQFDTFRNDSYGGNLALCGFPVSKDCNGQRVQELSTDDSESGLTWIPVFVGYCFGFLLGLIIGYIMFLTGKPRWFISIVEGDSGKKPKR